MTDRAMWFTYPVGVSEFETSDGFDFYVHRLPLRPRWWERALLRALRRRRVGAGVEGLKAEDSELVVTLRINAMKMDVQP